jgi:GAF domain-containing protein
MSIDQGRRQVATCAPGTQGELTALLGELVTMAAELAGARYGAIGVLDESGRRLLHFVTVGLTDAEVAAIGALPAGHGVLGALMHSEFPLRLDDLGRHPASAGVPSHHPPMRSFLGVPIRVDEEVQGRIYLTDKCGGRSFTDEDEALVTLVAAQAAATVHAARLQERVQRRLAELQALSEERSRLAVDMHDGALQCLFAVGLALQGAAVRLRDSGNEGAAAALGTAVDEIDAAMREIRDHVRDLRPAGLAAEAFALA